MRIPWPRSIAAQLVVLLVAGLLVGQLVAVAVAIGERREAVRSAFERDLAGRIASVVRLLEGTPPTLHGEVLGAVASRSTRYQIMGEPALGMPRSRAERAIAQGLADALGGAPEGGIRVAVVRRERVERQPTAEVDDRRGWHTSRAGGDRSRHHRRFGLATVALAIPLSDGQWLRVDARRFSPPARVLVPLATLLPAGIAISLVAVFFIRRVTRPLRQIADAATRLGRGERVPDIPETGPSEVRAATAAFNAMQARLDRFVTDRTRMLAAISHDLRTPLTTLRLRAEFVDDPELRARLIETVDEMNAMTEAALAFVRDAATSEETQSVDLVALVQGVLEEAREQGAEVTLGQAPAELIHPCRAAAVRRAIRNLVENAVRYAGSARITLTAEPSGPVIVVSDDGPGIPPSQLEQVFEPFFRLESSRNRETGGVGMGLASARSTARAHGGDVVLRSRAGGGLDAVVTLAAAT